MLFHALIKCQQDIIIMNLVRDFNAKQILNQQTKIHTTANHH